MASFDDRSSPFGDPAPVTTPPSRPSPHPSGAPDTMTAAPCPPRDHRRPSAEPRPPPRTRCPSRRPSASTKRARLLESGARPTRSACRSPTRSPPSAPGHAELETDSRSGDVVGLAGRVVHARNTGKLCFAALQAGDGTRIQAMVSLAEVGDESLARLERAWSTWATTSSCRARSSRRVAASCRSWSASGRSRRRRSCRCRTCTPS